MRRTFSKVLTICMASLIAVSSPIAAEGLFHHSISEVKAEVTVDTSWYDADKTEFTISTEAQLRGISTLLSTANKFKDCTIKLDQNIVLSDGVWTPIGTTKANSFQGVFDGQNHSISGLIIDRTYTSPPSTIKAGLFGTAQNAEIKNLTISEAIISECLSGDVTSKGIVASNQGTGALVGLGVNVKIDNCKVVDSNIKNDVLAGAGGLIGMLYGGSITNCEVLNTTVEGVMDNGLLGGTAYTPSPTTTKTLVENVSVQGNVISADTKMIGESANPKANNTGGIFGSVFDTTGNTEIKNAVVQKNSTIKGSARVGGIVGANRAKMVNCTNYASVTGTGEIVSGIAPIYATHAGAAYYENCVNHGNVNGNGYVAAIVSASAKSTNVESISLINCYNTGTVTTADEESKIGALAYVGDSLFAISNSYNTGEVKKNTENATQFDTYNTYTNVYYNSELGTADGAAIEGLTPATTAQFKDRTVVDGLNTGLDTPVWYQNTDYPDFASNMTLVEELAVPEKLEIAVGKTEEINASVTPADATNPAIAYEAKDEAIATVDNKGNVTAVKGGNTEITVKALDSGLSKTVAVTVTVPVTDIDVQIDKAELEIGQTAQITSTVAPEDATDKAVTYTSGDDKIVTVDDKGVVTAVAAGTVKITVKSGDVTKDISVTVKAKEEPATPTEPTKPSEQPTTPSEQPTKPSEQPTKPSEQPTTPSEQPTTPSEQPTKKEISSLTIQAVGNKTYTGKAITPSVTVKDGNKVLAAGTDYTLAYSNNKNVGTAKIIITGKGNYTGTATVSFKIVAAKGKSYYSGTNRYKVTNASATKGTVAYTGTKNKKATKLTIPATVKIGSVTYKVTSIAGNAFKNNKKLKTVVIGSNVTSIGTAAFYKCKALTSITIGKNVKTIGSKAFYGCSKLKKITVKSTKLTKVGSKALSGIHKKAVIKVPSKKLKAYQKLFKNKGQKKTVKIKK